MGDLLLHAIPTAFDLLALTMCLGMLGCRLWVLPARRAVPDAIDAEAVLASLWRWLGGGLAALSVSSLTELAGRTAEMSSQPLSGILPVLPIVLFHTHYGKVWLMRPIALVGLWLGWWTGRRTPGSRLIPLLMFGAGALMAMSRSGSGHAADWGDLTWPEIIDWVHLMAGSLWGGGLVTLSIILLPATSGLQAGRLRYIALLAQRFSTLAGVALAVVLLTGLYNAWVQLGSITAIWEAPYGRMLLGKLLLLIPLVALGASNRYISVPLLRRWSTPPAHRHARPRLPEINQRQARAKDRPRTSRLLHRFARKVRAEALFVVGILIFTALLLHGAPTRHAMHQQPTPMQTSMHDSRR